MQTKNIVRLATLGFLMAGLAAGAAQVKAQETTAVVNIQYPIEELGNCQDESRCKLYCDKPKNTEACLTFAEKNNLMSTGEVQMAKKFMAAETERPGGCATKNTCEEYCNDISHIDECLTFAEKNNIVSPEELAEGKKVQAAIKKGVKPPACGNKKACDAYCENPEHMEECITFGQAAGFLEGKELADAQKMLVAVKKGAKPPKCKGKEECDTYCSNPNNMEECMTFAMEAGFMSEQEKADSQKMLTAVKKGAKPPKCKGKEECDTYCGEESHFEECLSFAEAAGFMNPEEAKMARKTGGKGPGNCKGKEECEAFCNNPDNQETCFNFSKENGLMPEEELKRMEEGKQQLKQGLEQAPQEALDCLSSQTPSQDIGETMRQCFEKIGSPQQGGPGAGGAMPPGQNGPGGGGGMGISGPGNELIDPNQPQQSPGFPQNQPPCNSPEDCQKMQQQIQQQVQTQVQQIQQQMQVAPPLPCQGDNCSFGPQPSGNMPGGQPPTGDYPAPTAPMPTQQPMMEQGPQQPMAPPPAPGPAPPAPTSLNKMNILLGFIMPTFKLLSQLFSLQR